MITIAQVNMFMDFYLKELANPTVEAPGKGYIGMYSFHHFYSCL